MRLELSNLLVRLQRRIRFVDLGPVHHLVDLESRVARIQNPDFIHQHAFFYTPVGTLDKPVFVDSRKARQRRDKTDIRTFRRFNRTDTAVVRRVYVADFEAGALARQTAWSKRRKTPLMRDLRQRIRLIHELG